MEVYGRCEPFSSIEVELGVTVVVRWSDSEGQKVCADRSGAGRRLVVAVERCVLPPLLNAATSRVDRRPLNQNYIICGSCGYWRELSPTDHIEVHSFSQGQSIALHEDRRVKVLSSISVAIMMIGAVIRLAQQCRDM